MCADATRIWDSNPYAGMMRLQDGPYTNEGRVEVYCNGQWGALIQLMLIRCVNNWDI